MASSLFCVLFIPFCCSKILQLAYIEERGKLNKMKEFDETTIWTSDQIPLMASYNSGCVDVYIGNPKLIPPTFIVLVTFICNNVTFFYRKDATLCVGCGNK